MNGSIERRRGEGGFVLVVSLLVMAVLSVLATVFLWTAQTETTIATNYRNQAVAFHAAEAGIESGLVSLRQLLCMTRTPTDEQLAALEPAELNNPFYTFTNFQVTRVRATPPHDYRTFIATGPYTGLNAWSTDYRISAMVTGPRGSQARVNQAMKNFRIPLFQFGIFYGEGLDVELNPGANWHFKGRIHSNSDLYMFRETWTPSMKLDSYITAAGNYYHKTKTSNERRTNPEVCVGNCNGPDAGKIYQLLDFDREAKNVVSTSNWQPSNVDEWRAEALSRFGGRVQDSAHEVELIRPPIPDVLYDQDAPNITSHLMIEPGVAGDSAEMKEAKLYYEAGVIIHNNQGTIVGEDGTGTNLNIQGECPSGTVSTKTFYDAREQKTMNVTEVDIQKLTACGKMPANGVLYVHRSGSNAAVRLINGAQLPQTTDAQGSPVGLTVVSENPVYIKGDNNTDYKVPAAVMGDAITVLSKDFPDPSSNPPTNPVAANTTINAAFALGPHAESNPATASNGQTNNVIRLLENWTNKTFTYTGSLVALWHSQQATAPWQNSTYYKPPIRIWSYDESFDSNPPPGTPMGVLQTRGQWSSGS